MANKNSRLFEYVALVCAFVAASPVVYFLVEGLISSPQLRDAVVILVTVCLLFAIEGGIKPRRPEFSTSAFVALALSISTLFLANFAIRPNFSFFACFVPVEAAWLAYTVLAFLGFGFFVAAVGFVFFESKRFVYALSGGFASFSVISLFFQFADLPLRIWAGRAAGNLIAMSGAKVSMIFYRGELPQIALNVDGKAFLVATECNGFGIISACLIMSILIAIFLPGKWWRRLLSVAFALLVGFAANTLRIVCIIGAWRLFGEKYYYFYHEAIGYAFFGAALVFVWILAKKIVGKTADKEINSPEEQAHLK